MVNVHTRAQPKMCHISMQTCCWTAWWLCPRKQTDLKSVAASSFSLSWYYVGEKKKEHFYISCRSMRDSPQMLSFKFGQQQHPADVGIGGFSVDSLPSKNTQRCRNQKKKTWSRAVFSCLLSSQWKSVEALRFKRQREGGWGWGWGVGRGCWRRHRRRSSPPPSPITWRHSVEQR